MTEALTTTPAAQLVPASYAEKAMASLMQLHGELMDEKERRVDLFRRLMEREQALAELKMYVKVLEEKVAQTTASPKPPPPVQPVEVLRTPPTPRPTPERTTAAARVQPPPPPVPPQVIRGAAPRVDGWKTW